MREQTHSRNDVLAVVAALATALFLLSAIWAMREHRHEAKRPVVTSGFVPHSAVPNHTRRIEDRLWVKDSRESNVVPSPSEAYQLPSIPDSRRVWHESARGTESWGFVTERNAQEVGVSVLDYYEKLGGWTLARSEYLGLWASSWGCTVYRIQSSEAVLIVALPERLGEMPGGARNPTRVSVVRVAGKEAVRDVLGQAGKGGGEQ